MTPRPRQSALFSFGILRVCLVLLISSFIFCSAQLDAQLQVPSEKVSINVDVPAYSLKNQGQFDFHISYSWVNGKEPGPIDVECVPLTGITCKEKTQRIAHNRYEGVWTATMAGDPNLAEIDTSLVDGSGKTIGSETRGVDLGFRQQKTALTTNLPKSMSAGAEQRFRLWFLGKDKGTLIPNAAVHIELSSDNECADFRYEPGNPSPVTKSTYIDRGAVTIPAGYEQADGALYLRTHTWFTSTCTVDAHETVAGTTELGHDTFEFQVEPAIFPSLTLCFAGVLAQFLGSCLIQIIAFARARKRKTAPATPAPTMVDRDEVQLSWRSIWFQVFIGDSGSEILSLMLKLCLAYGLCWIAAATDKIGIKVDRSSLAGFFSFGFLVAFWPVEKLWTIFTPNASPSSGSTPAVEVAPLASPIAAAHAPAPVEASTSEEKKP